MKDQPTRQARRHARVRAQRERKKVLLPLGTVLVVIMLAVLVVQPNLKTASLHHTKAESESVKVVTSEKTKSSQPKDHAKKHSEKAKQTQPALWNEEKDAQLNSYIQRWQLAMGQHYQRYYPESGAGRLNFYGVSYPDDFAKQAINVSGRSLSVDTSKNGRGAADFNVVAIYSDIQQAQMNGHLYLFGFEDEQPHVLITQQNQGMPDGKVHFTDTANQDLADNFRRIVGSQADSEDSEATVPSQSSQIQVNPGQQIAV